MHAVVLRWRSLASGFVYGIVCLGTVCGWPRLPTSCAAEPALNPPRRILLLAGTVDGSHPAGTHEYLKQLQALQQYLQNSNVASRVHVDVVSDGWPQDVGLLRQADTIVLFSNGADRKETDHPFLQGERWDELRRAMDRGCGLILLHWSTFLPDRQADDVLEWAGGYFDYQEGDTPAAWYSRIQHATAVAQPADREHPICRGLSPFRLADEYYYRMRFRGGDSRRRPILKVALPGESGEQEVAWAVERANGGRGFVFTGCHFLNSLELPNFRRLLLNACVWTAHVEVPTQGVALATERPIRAVIVTGRQHPAHDWRETSLVLEDELRRDPRLRVETIPDPEFLGLPRLSEYDVVVSNYCNWDEPAGLSGKARENFQAYLDRGGGLVLVHFANGAFHPSLPGAAASDWPEYRTNICRRVWDHTAGRSGHDAYGPFRVDVDGAAHAITEGLSSYDTVDELYFRQQGERPIHVLATARSAVTGQDEPMAFVHDYGRGRVFQTVLGHAAESLRVAETAELLRRGAAWAAGYHPVPSAGTASSQHVSLVTGRFGRALDARQGHAWAEHQAAYDQWPLTVECWAQVQAKDRFQILVAKNPKSSSLHWELYTYAQAGDFSVYLPGYAPAEIRSGISIADGRWHHVAMSFDGRRVRLFVDGTLARQELVMRGGGDQETSPLWFGAYPPGSLGCEGLIDDVRISKVVRDYPAIPTEAAMADADTIGLWSFDTQRDAQLPDAAAAANHARLAADHNALPTLAPAVPEDHFEGFQESQVVDDRLSEMDVGRCLAATVATPDGPTWKSLVIRVGDERGASVCFDTELLRWSGAWDGFLDFSPARFGLIQMPKPATAPRLTTAREPGWAWQSSFADPRPKRPYGALPEHWGRYGGLHLHGERVVVDYRIGDMEVSESPWLETSAAGRAFTRSFEVSGSQAAQQLRICRTTIPVSLRSEAAGVELAQSADGYWVVTIPPRSTRARFRVWMGADERLQAEQLATWAAAAPLEDLAIWRQPGPARWTAELTVRGVRAADGAGPYVIDTIPLPFDNPYRALMFTSGHDFFSNGDAAVCTAHGDVWRVSGLDESLAQVRWKRMVAGLFQPLGLKIIGDTVYVACRDQLSVLHDRNGDHEIDYVENLNNEGHVSANGHEYVTNLECDSSGNFYVVKGDSGGVTDHDGCVLRISPDGKRFEVFATGIRNGNGLSIGPGDVITASPQEGNWTPASSILEITQGGFYGMMDVHHRATPPTAPDPPLCYIPRPLDNSSGGQVWCERDDWGPLSRQLLHFSFGRCRMLLVLRDRVGEQAQATVVPLPLEFESGAMRGRFRPQDGQLYVTGLRGWVTSAVRDGCFQRVRYTGEPACWPVACSAQANGVLLTFSSDVDRRLAEDPANFTVEAWNYRWSKDYGSDDYRVTAPEQKGRDVWAVRSASLGEDERTLFLEIPGIRPAQQVAITYSLADAAGRTLQNSLYATVHRLHAESIAPTSTVRAEKLIADEVEARLQPGLWSEWREAPQRGASHELRVVARSWPETAGSVAANGETQQVTIQGWLRSDQRQRVRWRIHGTGAAQLAVNGLRVLDAVGDDLSRFRSAEILLQPGFNRLELSGELRPLPGRGFRLTWQGESFEEELVPPQLLAHDPVTDRRASSPNAELLSDGRWLFERLRCANCHAPNAPPDREASGVDSLGPSLQHVGRRLRTEWLAAWLRDPHHLRPEATMPNVLQGSPTAARDALDIAAYLSDPAAQANSDAPPEPDRELVRRGERLFESLGCLACHTVEAADAATEPASAPDRFRLRLALTAVAQKYRPGELARFLSDPHVAYPSSRMPNFRLEPDEVAGLVAFLTQQSSEELPAVPLTDANRVRGAERFRALGCGHCHRHTDESPVAGPLAPLVAELDPQRGCLSANGDLIGTAPQFHLKPAERASLQTYLAAGAESHLPWSAAEWSRRAVEYLQCAACHDLDQQTAAWPQLLVEEGVSGLAPEKIPALTWAGEKLRAEWIERILRGELAYRPRPWLEARMPAFPHFAQRLALGLAAQHGVEPETSRSKPNLTESERNLAEGLLSKSGLDCRQCHAPAGEDLKLANQAQGIGLAFMADRLREDYFYRWLRDPLRIDPATKMPQFTTDGRTTKATHLAKGDAATQFQAIWKFLEAVEQVDETRSRRGHERAVFLSVSSAAPCFQKNLARFNQPNLRAETQQPPGHRRRPP